MAINQRHQEGVSVQRALAGEVAKMVAIASITNREEMVSIDQVRAKRGVIQGNKCQETGRIWLSPETT